MAWQWWDDFDMRMCGKWKSEELQINTHKITIFINIEFENNKSGVKVNFGFNDEDCGNLAFYTESSDNSFYFFHNDREHRAEYILTLENDNFNLMKCKLSIKNCFDLNNYAKNIEFTRISEPLSEEDIEKFKIRNKVAPKDGDKIDILREYSEYGDVKSDVKFEFKFDERDT